MATLTLRGVPEDVMERLRKRAARERRSVNAEGIQIIEAALVDDEMIARRREAALRLASLRRQLPPLSPDALDSVDLLREDRER